MISLNELVMNIDFSIYLFILDFFSDCSEAYVVTSEWGTGQKANIIISVPTATTTWKVTVTYDKDVKGIKVWKGKNEECNGKVCTFTNKREESLEEGQTLELVHRLGFQSEVAKVVGVDFNGEKICGAGTGGSSGIKS